MSGTDALTGILCATEAQLAAIFAPVLASVGTFLRAIRGAIFLPRHSIRAAAIVLAAMRAITGASPSAQFPRNGGVPKAPLPALVRATVRASAGLVLPGEGDRAAAWADARTWRAPDGKTLSIRLWRNGEQIRRRIDEALTHSVRAGLSPDEVLDRIEGLLINTAGRGVAPGNMRRLILNEGRRAHGVATIAAAGRVGLAIRWETGGGHSNPDECTRNAEADRYGLGKGVYPADRVPSYPAHVGCKCRLVQVRL